MTGILGSVICPPPKTTIHLATDAAASLEVLDSVDKKAVGNGVPMALKVSGK